MEAACAVPALAMMPANHRLAQKRLNALADLQDEEIIGATEQVAPGRDRSLNDACLAAGFTPRIAHVASSLTETIMTASQRNGVAIIGPLAMTVPHPGMVFLKIRPPGVLLELYTAYAVSAGPVVRDLARLLVAEFGHLNPDTHGEWAETRQSRPAWRWGRVRAPDRVHSPEPVSWRADAESTWGSNNTHWPRLGVFDIMCHPAVRARRAGPRLTTFCGRTRRLGGPRRYFRHRGNAETNN